MLGVELQPSAAVAGILPLSYHCCHYIFIISELWLTSHPRSTVVLLETGTPGTSREIYSEDADGETRTRYYNRGVPSSCLTIGIIAVLTNWVNIIRIILN